MKKMQCHIIDTYDDFLIFWANSRSKSIGEQVRLWKVDYVEKYPELLAKQVKSYEEMKVDLQVVAKKIMSRLPQRLKLMQEARENILQVYTSIYSDAAARVDVDFDINLVIYVGVGCGAGWATRYNDQPAILLGLENIAEEKWQTKPKLKGLISHEIGHLAHMKWRNQWESFEKVCNDPLFRLYAEGFATRSEQLILGEESWHMAPSKAWLSWCEKHKSWLAKEFLARMKDRASVNDFFGSWMSIRGKKQTGYFLGHGFIRELDRSYTRKRVATLGFNTVRKLGMQYLRSVSFENNGQAKSTEPS